MELRDLKAFVMLGEVLHFRKAAERLHVTQSALSKQIQRLEEEFGGSLFERGPVSTRLTPLGRTTLGEARSLVDAAERLAHRARLAAGGELGTLRIGFGVTTRKIAPQTIAAFREARPNVHIELHEMSALHQVQAMRDGRLDIGFCRLPVPDGWPTLPVLRESLVAALPDACPADIALEELAGIPFVTIDRARAPAFHDHAMSFLAQKGLRIPVFQTVTEFSTAVALAEAGVAWAIVPSSTAVDYAGLHVKHFDDPLAEWQIGLVRPPGDSGPFVEAFWKVVERVSAED